MIRYSPILFLLLLFVQPILSQNSPAAPEVVEQFTLADVFEPLVNKTWYAEGTWEGDRPFRQAVTFSYAAESQVVTTATQGFVDENNEKWGQRSHGVRYWSKQYNQMLFTEYDAFGGVTEGIIKVVDSTIYYHYDYLGLALTDAWERVDDNRYRFRVGLREQGEWSKFMLDTYFTTEPFATVMEEETALPYRQIPEAPDEYNACTVAARTIDGLGFRYYWATEGLRTEDLEYKPSPEGRTSAHTLEHLYGLAEMIHHAVLGIPNVRPSEEREWTFAEQRAATLRLLKAASDKLRVSHPAEMEKFKIIFERGEGTSTVPFWNVLNGPIGDALWHTGQIVLMRRASGNPLDGKVNVFRGIRG